MDTKQVHLFNQNGQLVSDFDDKIEEILISVHGDNYYDVDEELVDANSKKVEDVVEEKYEDGELDATMEMMDTMVGKNTHAIHIVNAEEKHKIKFTDFLPLFFFILIFAIIVIGGYYFLNSVDISTLIHR